MPVSNLTHVSKCLEKIIAQQLMEHTSEMTELYQSANKSNNSTETALIAVCDLLLSSSSRSLDYTDKPAC